MTKKSSSLNLTKKLTESAVMLALTVVLSYLKLLDLPYGGSVTFCSMLPVIIFAYRHGMLWGLGVGFANGVLQLLMGMSALSYATSPLAAVMIILLDYIVAFSVTGFGGVFKKAIKNQSAALVLGTVLACFLRYVCHLISGCTVWAGLSIPTADAFIYSVAYNATYMLPELIIAVLGAAYLGSAIDFSAENLTRIAKINTSKNSYVLKLLALLGVVAALIWDVILIAPHLQNAETGNFDITGITKVNFTFVLAVTVIGCLWFAVLYAFSRFKSKKH